MNKKLLFWFFIFGFSQALSADTKKHTIIQKNDLIKTLPISCQVTLNDRNKSSLNSGLISLYTKSFKLALNRDFKKADELSNCILVLTNRTSWPYDFPWKPS